MRRLWPCLLLAAACASPDDARLVFCQQRPDVCEDGGGSGDSGSISTDSGTVDSGAPDSGAPDTGSADSGTPDAGRPDAGGDAGSTDAGGYADVILRTSGLLSYWRLDDFPGAGVRDFAGSVSGTVHGTVTVGVPGLLRNDPDTAMSFNTGGTGYLDFGDVYDFAGDAGGSWELWFQPAMATVSYDRLLSHEVLDGGTNSREGWDLLWSGTAFQFERWRGTLHDIVGVPSNQIDAGVTYHVVVTYDGTTLSMFLDGQLLASQPAALQLRPPGTPFRIGMASFGNNPFYGTVDEAAIYSRALTPAEVWQHYDAGLR